MSLPTIQDLHHDREVGFKQDSLNYLLNQNVPQSWVKKNPYANNTSYLPIDKVEYLLTKIFGGYEVQVIEFKQLFNSVACHIRLTITNPIDGTKIVQDGLGAVDVQTNAGASPSDLSQIKQNAIMKALPAAESYAIKDAAEKLGQIFGSNLNRKDTVQADTIDKIKDRWKI